MFLQSNQQSGKAVRIVTLGSLDSPTDWGTSLWPKAFIKYQISLLIIFLVPKSELWREHRPHWISGIELQKKIVKL